MSQPRRPPHSKTRAAIIRRSRRVSSPHVEDIRKRHRGIKEGPTIFFFCDKNQAGNVLFAFLIPDDDLDDVFVKFGPGILAGHFEFVGAGSLRIENVEFLIQLWCHQGFNLKAIRVQRMHRTPPCLRYGLRVLGVLRNLGRILNPCSESDLSSRYDRIFHDCSNPTIVNDNVLYHSLIKLASVGGIWCEMTTQPRESHSVLEADFWPASSRVCSGHNFRLARDPGTNLCASDRGARKRYNPRYLPL